MVYPCAIRCAILFAARRLLFGGGLEGREFRAGQSLAMGEVAGDVC
jgi:hypothetical protein